MPVMMPAMMPATRPLVALLLALAMAQGLVVALAADLVVPVATVMELEHYLQLHKPTLNKAIFFSKMGSSSLCKKLGAEFEGRVAFSMVAADAADVAAKFGVTTFPALRLLLTQAAAGTDITVSAYEGGCAAGPVFALPRAAGCSSCRPAPGRPPAGCCPAPVELRQTVFPHYPCRSDRRCLLSCAAATPA